LTPPAAPVFHRLAGRSGVGAFMPAPALSAPEIEDLLHREFPQVFRPGSGLSIEQVAYGSARVRQAFSPGQLRPGGTISGPTMMALADFTMYVVVFSVAGAQPLAVTTNLSINFLRKPGHGDLIADARALKAGKRLIVGEVTIHSEGEAEPVAHVTATYSVPPR
jgi:uncharacterized protein (TIGR00369 family)